MRASAVPGTGTIRSPGRAEDGEHPPVPGTVDRRRPQDREPPARHRLGHGALAGPLALGVGGKPRLARRQRGDADQVGRGRHLADRPGQTGRTVAVHPEERPAGAGADQAGQVDDHVRPLHQADQRRRVLESALHDLGGELPPRRTRPGPGAPGCAPASRVRPKPPRRAGQ